MWRPLANKNENARKQEKKRVSEDDNSRSGPAGPLACATRKQSSSADDVTVFGENVAERRKSARSDLARRFVLIRSSPSPPPPPLIVSATRARNDGRPVSIRTAPDGGAVVSRMLCRLRRRPRALDKFRRLPGPLTGRPSRKYTCPPTCHRKVSIHPVNFPFPVIETVRARTASLHERYVSTRRRCRPCWTVETVSVKLFVRLQHAPRFYYSLDRHHVTFTLTSRNRHNCTKIYFELQYEF